MNRIVKFVIILIVIVLGGYFLLRGSQTEAPSENIGVPNEEPNMSSEPNMSVESGMPIMGNNKVVEKQVMKLITYTNGGYSPSTLNIQIGDTVTFQNDSSEAMWSASGMHPTHTLYSGTSRSNHCPDLNNTSFDACKGYLPGTAWSFTFTKVGTWKYHNHLNPTFLGTIVVE